MGFNCLRPATCIEGMILTDEVTAEVKIKSGLEGLVNLGSQQCKVRKSRVVENLLIRFMQLVSAL